MKFEKNLITRCRQKDALNPFLEKKKRKKNNITLDHLIFFYVLNKKANYIFIMKLVVIFITKNALEKV